MKKRKKIQKLLALILVVSLMSGCTSPLSAGKNPQEKFDEFSHEIFLDIVTSDTISLHYTLAEPEKYGITPGPVTFGDLSVELDKENFNKYKSWRQKIAKVDSKSLAPEQQVTFDVLVNYLDNQLESADYYYYYEPLTPATGIHTTFPYLLAEYIFYDVQDVEDYLALIAEIDTFFQAVITWEEKRAQEGLLMSDEMLDKLIGECEPYQFGNEIDENNFMADTFRERLDGLTGLTEAQKSEYVQKHNAILISDFSAAYQNLSAELEKLKGGGKNEQGICYLPKGKEYYEYLIESDIGMTYDTVDDLYNDILMNISTNFDSMLTLISENPELAQEWLYMEEERTPDEMLDDLKVKVQEKFPEIPETNYGVRYVAESMEEFMSPAFYLTPPIDRYTDNVIYVNQGSFEDRQNLYSTLSHEGYPGHLYQNVYFRSNNKSDVRKCLGYIGYTEGWATYVQYCSAEWNEMLPGNLKLMDSQNDSLNLAFSALFDIGINYYGWNKEETTQKCKELLGISDEDTVNNLYMAVIGDPAAYLNYYVGYLEIMKLRTNGEYLLGDTFNEKEFHKFLLDMGPAPFTIISKYYDRWLEDQLSSLESASTKSTGYPVLFFNLFHPDRKKSWHNYLDRI